MVNSHEQSAQLPVKPATQDMLERIRGVQHLSYLRPFGPEAAKAALPEDEVNMVFAALRARREELSAHGIQSPAGVAEATTPSVETQPWNPSDILETLPQSDRDRDWRERQYKD